MTDETKSSTLPDDEMQARQRAMCDHIIARATRMMIDEARAPLPMVLDRLLTFCGAQAASIEGSVTTAAKFRAMADKIESGFYWSITGEGLAAGRRDN